MLLCLVACTRDAQIEKKMARREAARERDASPDLVKLPGGGDIMGGDDSLAAARARHGALCLAKQNPAPMPLPLQEPCAFMPCSSASMIC